MKILLIVFNVFLTFQSIFATPISLGNPNSPVKIEYHYAFSCYGCRLSFEQIFLPLKRDFIDAGKVHFVFREHAMHVKDLYSLILLDLVAPEFRENMLQEILTTEEIFSQKNFMKILMKIGVKYGISVKKIEENFSSNELKEKILRNCEENSNAVNATPQIVINGRFFEGNYKQLQFLLEMVT